MQIRLYWDDIQYKDSSLPGEWEGSTNMINAARQVYELNPQNGYRAFAAAGNDDEKWVVMLLWQNDDTERKHPYILKVFMGPEPTFDSAALRVGL